MAGHKFKLTPFIQFLGERFVFLNKLALRFLLMAGKASQMGK